MKNIKFYNLSKFNKKYEKKFINDFKTINRNGRLVLGVGRGAFGYEMGRMGVPLEISSEKFDESLEVLIALLSEEEVSWNGKYYLRINETFKC